MIWCAEFTSAGRGKSKKQGVVLMSANCGFAVMDSLPETPELKSICDRHGALIVEDAAESLGAEYKIGSKWLETGALGDYNCISFNGNKIITGSTGGMFLTDFKADADKVRKWSTQSREDAPWYQHEEIGYNYRMSNIIAGVVRGQMRSHIVTADSASEGHILSADSESGGQQEDGGTVWHSINTRIRRTVRKNLKNAILYWQSLQF